MKIITIGLVVAVVLVGFYFFIQKDTPEDTNDLGGLNQDYNATSTAANAIYGAFTGDQLLRTGHGTLGAMVITGANTGVVNFYNATTSNVNLRTGQKASSTILMASLPASLAAGTYTFDAIFTNGLWVELESGVMPTSTIVYR